MLADLRLYQLISPALPVGAFTYSQGLEWAIECGWVTDAASLEEWLVSALEHSVATLELPVLLRLCRALEEGDEQSFGQWCDYLHASRETSELRAEERQRAQALLRLLPELDVPVPDSLRDKMGKTQIAGMVLAAKAWDIDSISLGRGYLWSWLENAVMAGVKLVPLGQTAGQKMLLDVSARLPALLEQAPNIADWQVGSSTPALAIASSKHETQYSRLFRS
ncbi:urease accessory protein UreF [Marinobacterium lutimaris]|uniref:Urease accessory protein UreF n=1 Tax=Marinobacterium lutimaris TaxID=568106 RepID=A0A1H5V5E3_9GAMM|nr:urease accessory protein UreF [Marinobacterium lutimaris]SEF82595.1 urease accessory protein [Marinobacterium lutimaris]